MGAQWLCKPRAGVRSSLGPPSLGNDMKTRKPRNHVALALMKRGGSGSHTKSHKQLRRKLNREGWDG